MHGLDWIGLDGLDRDGLLFSCFASDCLVFVFLFRCFVLVLFFFFFLSIHHTSSLPHFLPSSLPTSSSCMYYYYLVKVR